ncbi:uncharacterized protein BDR25DRAFT_304558 [Lindgomyces ingoldianus]|uniref:Uncharacterized protein n=1 Tax=Lindgomyces ingoldianus TaxID=673940 RepID=A0ACB6QRE7_9PLEO|nr:uncharacterized protein BDR25DRAFT_304558 [Lindgomyces ingoldianus]KAF2469501.1 hypothetical protein BDR25DRAFT_304558 [Lindgomyces ingoldianus]
MNTIRNIQNLNKRELEEGVNPEASWHTDYRDTAFIYVGGLPFELSEGDIITVFSQFGEPTWIKLARDKETGKSRGFCWIKYEDQRSTDLAVDNLGGATVMGRILRVDHARYKPRDDEDMKDNTMGDVKMSDEEEDGRRKRRRTDSESESEDERPMLPEEIQLAKLIRDIDDEDPMKPSMLKSQQERVDAALNKYNKTKKKERKHRHSRRGRSKERHRDRDRRRIKDDVDEDNQTKSRRQDNFGDRHRDSLPERQSTGDKGRDDALRPSKSRHRGDSRTKERDHDRRRGKSDDEEGKTTRSKQPSRRDRRHRRHSSSSSREYSEEDCRRGYGTSDHRQRESRREDRPHKRTT